MAGAILTRDKQGVLAVFKLQGSPVFSLWENTKEPAFTCADDDVEERHKMLEQYLDIIKNSGTAAAYKIKFHEEANKSGKVNNTTPVCGSLEFKLNEGNPNYEISRMNGAGGSSLEMMKELFAAKMETIEQRYEQRIKDLEREHEEELRDIEEEENPGDLGMVGKVGALGEKYPWMQDILKEGVGMLKDFMTVAKHKMRPPGQQRPGDHGIAGVPAAEAATMSYAEKISAAQNTLLAWYAKEYGDLETKEGRLKGANMFADDLLKLAELSADDDVMHLALKKLRSF